MRRSQPILLVVLTALATGCSPKYRVHVNGFVDNEARTAIDPPLCVTVDEAMNTDNPLFQTEIRRKIETVLGAYGHEVCPAESADYELRFRYGTDGARTIERDYLHHEPGHTIRVRTHDSEGRSSYSRYYVPGTTYWRTRSETVFSFWLVLSLYDLKQSKPAEQTKRPIWMGEMTVHSGSSDWRSMVDPMLIAGFEYFGQDTGERVTEVITPSDPLMERLSQQ